MNKIIVEVRVPAIGKVYDAKIPKDIQVWEATKLLSGMIAGVDEGLYAKDNQAVLCDYDTGAVLDINKLVGESGLSNGSRLMVV